MKKIKKTILFILYAIPYSMILWGILSWLEVALKNFSPDPQYCALNLFEILTKM